VQEDIDSVGLDWGSLPGQSKLPKLEPGVVVKHYELIRQLGTGGMGTVFLARDTRLGRLVAVKFLLEHSGPAARRFLAEARTTAQCRHENIVVIYDVDEIDGYPYMVLEYIQGKTLRAALMSAETGLHRMGPAHAVNLAIEVMISVVRGLVCAHEMEIVHRDLKPENILLADSGVVRVVDFGIAKQVSVDLGPGSPSKPASVRLDPAVLFANESATLPIDQLPTVEVARANQGPMTRQGALLGTVPYMSPEQWLLDPIDGRTDIWAVGIILFEMLLGKHPLAPFSIAVYGSIGDLDTPMPSMRELVPAAGLLADIVDRCLQKRREDRYGSAKELLAALEGLTRQSRPVDETSDEETPFAGLAAFQEADAARFFGRERDIATLVSKLRSHPIVAIAGPSGAGKSSFVRAGIIPALKRTAERTEALILRPGRRPLMALAEALVGVMDQATKADPESIANILRMQPGYLGTKLRERCRERSSEGRLVLFVDQLEELYTLGIDDQERAAFAACIEGVGDDASSPLRVLLTIRGDFLERLSEDRRFLEEITRGLVFLPPMTREGLRDALKKPLEHVQYRFQDDNLVDEMLAGLAGTTSPLPLLQFTASKLWESRNQNKRLLTREAYEALGGVAGALSTHADAVLGGLTSREQQLARTLFVRLVTPERTRAIVRLSELSMLDMDEAAVTQIVDRLANARLLSIEANAEGEEASVELLHESLIERWSKLKQWLDEDAQDAQFVAELRNAAQQWEKNGKAEGFLWRDRAAETAGQWRERRRQKANGERGLGLSTREQKYLDAVVQLAERNRRRRRNITIGVVTSATAIAAVVSLLALQARAQALEANLARQRAESAGAEAKTKAIEASDARLLAGARELSSKLQFGLATKLLVEVQRPMEARGFFTLANDTLSYDSVLQTEDGMQFRPARRESLLEGHTKALSEVSWSHDGKRVLTASADGTTRIWSADGRGNPLILASKGGAVAKALWSPDDNHVLTAYQDGSVWVWNSNGRGNPEERFAKGKKITAMAWSRRGDVIAVAGEDSTIRVRMADGKTVELTGHTDTITNLDFLAASERLLSASLDATARLWDFSKPDKPLVLKGHKDAIQYAESSPDGSRILTVSADKTARIWNADGKGNSVVLEGHESTVQWGVFSPDGNRVATASTDKTVRIWRLDGSAPPVVLSGHRGPVTRVAWRFDGQYVVTSSTDGNAFVWPSEGGTALACRGHDGPVLSAAFSPDGTRVLTGVTGHDDAGTREFFAAIFHADRLSSLARPRKNYYHSARIDARGEFVVSAHDDRTVSRWRLDETANPVILAGYPNWVAMAMASPDGKYIVSAGFDKTARITALDDSNQSTVLEGHAGPVRSAVWSPDGLSVATISDDKTARIFAIRSQEQPRILSGHTDGLTAIAFAPDGKRIVTASMDQTARIYDLQAPQGEALVLKGHVAPVLAVAWSSDGKRIVTGSADRTARIWNAETGMEERVFEHEERVLRVLFSPDGQRIATASADARVLVNRTDGVGEAQHYFFAQYVLDLQFQNAGRELLVLGSNHHTRTLLLDEETLKQRLRASNSECLPEQMRVTYLGETETVARAGYEDCETSQGRAVAIEVAR